MRIVKGMTAMKKQFLWVNFVVILLLFGCSTTDPVDNVTPTGPIGSIREECTGTMHDWPTNPEKVLSDDVKLVNLSKTFTGYFDTLLQITIFVEEGTDPTSIWRCTEAIFKAVHLQGTRYDASEEFNNIYAINQAPGVWHDIDFILYDMIAQSIDFYDTSDGLFNIALGPVIDIWRATFDGCDLDACSVPSIDDLTAANQYTSIDGIVLQKDPMQVMIEDGMLLDLGGIGKGYGASLVGDFLKWHPDVHKFLLNAGNSNIEVYGSHPTRDNQKWWIALVHPDSTDLVPLPAYARVFINDGDNIMSSGDYQRYVIIDGIRYHHLIDPQTLFPSRAMRSVTVIGPDGTYGDLLATALFMRPLEEALEMINNTEHYEAIFYANDGTVHFSAQFEALYLDEVLID